MKITIAQLNYHIGNFDWNFNKISDAIRAAKSENSDLIIFSELAICGYFPFDLLEKKYFIENSQKYLEKIATLSQDIAIIIGLPSYNDTNKGEKLFNSAVFIENGKIKNYIHKTVLSSYDVFDEYRYFEPNINFNIINLKNKKLAITICEDLYYNQKRYDNFNKEQLYIKSPLEELAKFNPDICINISASPYSYNNMENIQNTLKSKTLKYSIPIIYVNQVGANTDLIFDGGSLVVNKGKIIAECKRFEEDIKTINTSDFDIKKNFEIKENNRIENIYNALVLGVSDFFNKNSFKKAVIGLSGGIDSAVTLAIAIEALGNDNVMSILMPTKYSSNHSINDSIEMLNRTKSPHEIINIENIRLSFLYAFSEIFANCKENVAEENIQARIRGTILMAYSNKFGNILLNTSNKSEFAVGYSTLYGDMNGALSILGDVYKTDIYYLANYINKYKGDIIPENIITKEPSAELRPNQKDKDSLPAYDILDKILFSYIEEKLSKEEIINFNKETVEKVITMVNNNEFKRFQSAPILRISSKAFGRGRRFPIVAKY